jgi:hypothetical protein
VLSKLKHPSRSRKMSSFLGRQVRPEAAATTGSTVRRLRQLGPSAVGNGERVAGEA